MPPLQIMSMMQLGSFGTGRMLIWACLRLQLLRHKKSSGPRTAASAGPGTAPAPLLGTANSKLVRPSALKRRGLERKEFPRYAGRKKERKSKVFFAAMIFRPLKGEGPLNSRAQIEKKRS